MRTSLLPLLAVLAAAPPPNAVADVASDRPAAILVFPRVIARTAEIQGDQTTTIVDDTLVQISNTTPESVTLQCFYIAVNGRCSASESPCHAAGSEYELPCPLDGEVCVPGWTETDFRITLTPHQPIAWRASTGLAREQFPLDGVAFRGPRGESNAGSAVPPVTIEPISSPNPNATGAIFVGELKCVVVDAEGRAVDRNAVKGEATLVSSRSIVDGQGASTNLANVDRHNAIGIQAIGGDANGDGVLEIGGEAGEYNACPSVLVLEHYFDSAGKGRRDTAITLLPCSQDIRAQKPAVITAQYVVLNEFEQRFSTSAPVDCYYNRRLSSIDTRSPDRSIFSAAVAGTTVGQTRIRGVQGGLLGVVVEDFAAESGLVGPDASSNLHFQGERQVADRLVLP